MARTEQDSEKIHQSLRDALALVRQHGFGRAVVEVAIIDGRIVSWSALPRLDFKAGVDGSNVRNET